MSATTTADPDEVSILIGGTRFQGWQTVSITRSVESMPNAWTVTASTEFMQGAALSQIIPGKTCQVFIGSDLVITGRIDRRRIKAGPREHIVTISGRGMTRNLVDCSADLLNDPKLTGGMLNASNTLDLATRLAESFKVSARSAVADLGIPIPNFQVGLGETPYQIIESVARYAGYLVYEDETGTLVLDRVGTQSMASGFAMPGNIEDIDAERSIDGRFSHYVSVWSPIASLTQISSLAIYRGKPVIDAEVFAIEYRPKILVSPQTTPAYDVGVAMSNWEWARRIGRSQAANIIADRWRDSAGKLWTPNWLATIEAPGADITGAKWIIGAVTYRKDMSGTHADLILMPPDAFKPEPNPLNLFDAQLMATPATTQNPAPPATTAPLGDTPASTASPDDTPASTAPQNNSTAPGIN